MAWLILEAKGVAVAVAGEAAAAWPPDGPPGPGGPGNGSWLILQRLDDLRRAQDELRRGQDDLRAEMGGMASELRAEMGGMASELRAEMGGMARELRAEIDSVRTWSLGLLLLAILGLLAKLLFPSA